MNTSKLFKDALEAVNKATKDIREQLSANVPVELKNCSCAGIEPLKDDELKECEEDIIDNKFYKEARMVWEGVQKQQINKGLEKYGRPLEPGEHTLQELFVHAVEENVDQMHYLQALFEKGYEMERKYKTMETAAKLLKEDNAHLYERVQRLEKDCSEMNAKLNDNDAGVNWKATVIKRDVKIDELKKEINRLKAEYEDLDEENEKGKMTIIENCELRKEIERLENNVDYWKSKSEKWRQESGELLEEVENWKEEAKKIIINLENDKEGLRDKIRYWENQTKEERKINSDFYNRIKKLQNENEGLKEENKALGAEVDKSDTIKEKYKKNIAELKEKNEELKSWKKNANILIDSMAQGLSKYMNEHYQMLMKGAFEDDSDNK